VKHPQTAILLWAAHHLPIDLALGPGGSILGGPIVLVTMYSAFHVLVFLFFKVILTRHMIKLKFSIFRDCLFSDMNVKHYVWQTSLFVCLCQRRVESSELRQVESG
jgi:hypothetical protein